MPSDINDADDLEAVRAHFGIEKPDLIGFSYLGKLVVLYATQHPDHVNRIVQIGPVARKLGTKFPATLTAGDEDKIPDPAQEKKLAHLYEAGFARDHPKEYLRDGVENRAAENGGESRERKQDRQSMCNAK
jgi:pimeloyl-ACP methyl ester carboxylesterase